MKDNIEFVDLLKQIPNKYVLTRVAGQRCRDLKNGAEPLVKKTKKMNNVQVALTEIVEQKVVVGRAEVVEGEE